jgi:nucleoid-associated protein Lsr2
MTHIQAINRGRKPVSSKVVVILEDDVDGGKADETVEFGLDGAAYAIDLSDSNAKKLRDALDGYVSKARKVGGKRSTSRKTSSGVDLKAVRAWAASNGVEVSGRGRVSQAVLEQYRAAGN